VTVEKDGEEVDGKSILGILLLGAGQGSQVTIRCDGQDEEEAMRAVTGLIANRFDEES
jgi:phosphocarrier protein HPr